MSTVIANAFAVSHCDLPRLHRAIEETRTTVRALARKAHASLVAERTCSRIDRAIACGREWTPSPLGTVWGEVDDASRGIETTGMRDPACDFGFELSLVPDPVTESVYGIIHCEHDAWRRTWMRRPEVRDFSWDNRSDRPSSVRVAEWRLREETWDRILPTGVPAEHGFSARITPSRLIHTVPDPLRHQPSLEARRRAVAREILFDKLVREDGEASGADGHIQSIMRAASKARRPENVERLARIAERVRIPRRIGMDLATSRTPPEVLDLA